MNQRTRFHRVPALLALLAGSVLRSGPRRWFLALQPWGDPHDHDAATPVAGAC